MPAPALVLIVAVVLVVLGGAPFLIVLERRKIALDRKTVQLHRKLDDPVYRGLVQDQADLLRTGTPEALAARRQIGDLVREMRISWEASESDPRRYEAPDYLRKLAAALQARDEALKDAQAPPRATPMSDPQAPA